MPKASRLLQIAAIAVACTLLVVLILTDGRFDSAMNSLAGGIGDSRQLLDNMTFSRRVTVIADGEERALWTSARTVQDALTFAGLGLGPMDRTIPDLSEPVEDQQQIRLIRVDSRIVEEQAVIPYRTVRVASRSMNRGETREVQPGANGKQLNTYQVLLEDGQPVKKELINSVTVVEKQDRVIEEGTISTLSRGGQTYRYSRMLSVTATAYTSDINPETGLPDDPYQGMTASGKRAVAGTTIATDPKVIPTGTRVYVEGVDAKGKQYSGLYVAMDVGSAIKGNRIDIYMETFAECYSFGRRKMNVYILE
jgi:3D (Asp-Asp-Asp) domain-containing protein